MRKNIEWNDFEDAPGIPMIWDPAHERIVYDELPTLSIKKFVKRSNAITTENLASHHFGSGSVMRITRFSIWSTLGGIFGIKDQSGTLNEAHPGSSSEYFLGGAPKEPIFNARSNFTVSHVGSQLAGTVLVSFEGFTHPAEAGFAHRSR